MILITCISNYFNEVKELIKIHYNILEIIRKQIPNFICQNCNFQLENIYIGRKECYYFIKIKENNYDSLNIIKNNSVIKNYKISINIINEEYYNYFNDIFVDYNSENPCCEIFNNENYFLKLSKILKYFYIFDFKEKFEVANIAFFSTFINKQFNKSFKELFYINNSNFNNNLLDYWVPFNIYTQININYCFLKTFQVFFWKLLEIQINKKSFNGIHIIIEFLSNKLIINKLDDDKIMILKELILENIINYFKIIKNIKGLFIFNLNFLKLKNIEFMKIKKFENEIFYKNINIENIFLNISHITKTKINKELYDYIKQLNYLITIINNNYYYKYIILVKLIDIIYFLIKCYIIYEDENLILENMIITIKTLMNNIIRNINFKCNKIELILKQILIIKFNLSILLNKYKIKFIRNLLYLLDNFDLNNNNLSNSYDINDNNKLIKIKFRNFSSNLFYDKEKSLFYIIINFHILNLLNNINIIDDIKINTNYGTIDVVSKLTKLSLNESLIEFNKYLTDEIKNEICIEGIIFKIKNINFIYNLQIKSNSINEFKSINLINKYYKYQLNNKFILFYDSYYEIILDFKIFNNYNNYNINFEILLDDDSIDLQDEIIFFFDNNLDNNKKINLNNMHEIYYENINHKLISILIKFKIHDFKKFIKLNKCLIINTKIENDTNIFNSFEINPNLLNNKNYLDLKTKKIEDKIMLKFNNKLDNNIKEIQILDKIFNIDLKKNEKYNIILDNFKKDMEITYILENPIIDLFNSNNTTKEIKTNINFKNLINNYKFDVNINFSPTLKYLDTSSIFFKLVSINESLNKKLSNSSIFIEIENSDDFEIIDKNIFEYQIFDKNEVNIEIIPLKVGYINFPKIKITVLIDNLRVIFKDSDIKYNYGKSRLFVNPIAVSHMKVDLFN